MGMGECFYSVLDIPRDADADTVESAYRDRVKTHHPDVSDAPDASDRFKRLTVARDTLVDADERARYDRLGHAEYVRRFAPPDLFDVQTDTTETAAGQATASQASSVSTESNAVATDGGSDPWWNNRASTTGTASTASAAGGTRTTKRSRTAENIYGTQTNTSSGGDVARDGPEAVFATVRKTVDALGMWVFVHLLLFVSAGLTAWFTLTTPISDGFSMLAVVVFGLLTVVVLLASVVHLVVTLHD